MAPGWIYLFTGQPAVNLFWWRLKHLRCEDTLWISPQHSIYVVKSISPPIVQTRVARNAPGRLLMALLGSLYHNVRLLRGFHSSIIICCGIITLSITAEWPHIAGLKTHKLNLNWIYLPKHSKNYILALLNFKKLRTGKKVDSVWMHSHNFY